MNPEHMAAAHELLASVDYGTIAAAELLATQLAEVDRLTREIAKQDEVTKLLALRVADAELGLAERTRERDDDRRLVCDWASRPAGVTPREKAAEYGWGYLYPEEPQP